MNPYIAVRLFSKHWTFTLKQGCCGWHIFHSILNVSPKWIGPEGPTLPDCLTTLEICYLVKLMKWAIGCVYLSLRYLSRRVSGDFLHCFLISCTLSAETKICSSLSPLQLSPTPVISFTNEGREAQKFAQLSWLGGKGRFIKNSAITGLM